MGCRPFTKSILDHPSAAPLEYASSCFLPTDWISLELAAKREYNHDSTVYQFKLPRCTSLNLPACGCILALAPGAGSDGSDVVRPYTPISEISQLGSFEILVKRYDDGAMSSYLYSLPVGAPVQFKHIKFNLKRQYPFPGIKTFSLLCAGSGITPMYQALMKLMSTVGDNRKVVLLYGNKSAEDILMKAELEAWAVAHSDRLRVVHIIGNAPDDLRPEGWSTTDTYVAETGWIDAEKIKKYCFTPSEDTAVFICGLPNMYEALCGPRGEAELKPGTVLETLGYTSDMITKL